MKAGRPKLLVIDDGNRHIELAHELLRGYDYATRCELPGPCWECTKRTGCTLTHAHDAFEADDALARHSDVDVVLLDVAFNLPDERLVPSDEPDPERRRRTQGLAILQRLRRTQASLPVVLMTSEQALRVDRHAGALAADELVTFAGADAFDARALGLLIERVLARTHDTVALGGYAWGETRSMLRIARDVQTLARTSLPMLVLGETGTGKSALAEHVIHPASRRTGPFVAVDLSALPETLVAAELFGTARGAFSGAVDRPGRFERAHGGTLLLDEIGNLTSDLQRMLLRALEDGAVTRLGETTPRAADVKLVAATNVDLAGAVSENRFRQDLYARLAPASRIELPPLRDRAEDLLTLARGLVRRAFSRGTDRVLLVEYADRHGIEGPVQAELAFGKPPHSPAPHTVTFVLAPSTVAAMRAHRWLGNVRELELFVKSAAVFALADALHAHNRGRDASDSSAAPLVPVSARLAQELLDGVPLESSGSSRSVQGPTLARAATLHEIARSLERAHYARLFDQTGGDFRAMAKLLLTGDPDANARRVRLRFNQLGLRARRK